MKENLNKTVIRNLKFVNWSQTFSCNPEYFFAPESEEQILEILEFAREESKRVKVVGCGHSPSDIACSPDVMISLQKLNKIIKVDREKYTVKAQSGILIKELNEVYLRQHDLAISSLGALSDFTLGGVISTGTHGSGKNFGTFSSCIVELELITSMGKRITCSRNENRDIFLAAACGLGSIGIIVTVTLQCEPAFKLHEQHYSIPLEQVLNNVDTHLNSSEHFRFLWYPHTDSVVCFHLNRTDLPVTKSPFLVKAYNWIKEYVIGYYIMELALYISTFYPPVVPFLNRFFFRVLFESSGERVDISYRIFNYECRFKQYVNEWSIPKENAALAIYKIKEFIDNTPGMYVHIPVEVRFVKEDDVMISPAYGRASCYINIIMYKPYKREVPFREYWDAYENIMMSLDGRPHWAKAHRVTSKEFKVMYPHFGRWCQIRQQLDPIDLFVNPYLYRILYT